MVATTRVQKKNPGAGWPRGSRVRFSESDYAVRVLTYFTVHLRKFDQFRLEVPASLVLVPASLKVVKR